MNPLNNEKHCEMLGANARVAGDAMRDGFKLFVQLFSAIVGGSIALRLSASVGQPKLLTNVAPLAVGLVVFVGLASAGLIADSFRSFLRQRWRLTELAGKDSNDADVVPLPDYQSWITIIIMEIVIAGSVLAFWYYNPLRLMA